MSFTAYDYRGTINNNASATTSFYEEPGLSTLAFITGTLYTDPFIGAGAQICLFTTIFGSFSNGTTYYAAGGVELTPAAGDILGVAITGVDSAGITGIGSRASGDGSNCFYTIAGGGAGSYTPVLAGYDFTPASETATSGLGVMGFSAEVGASPPGKASNPSPANSATGVSINQGTLTWDAGSDADYEQVYFGPSGNLSLVDANDTDQSFSLAAYLPLNYNSTYQWRIDSVNDNGTTTGDVWSFTTLAYSPPNPTVFQVVKRLVACAENRFWYENI